VKALALMLLCSCAAQPASLPYVRVDPSLQGAVVSRKAAETIAELRIRERTVFEQQVADANQRTQVAEARERHNSWMADNWPWIVAVVGVVAGGAGVAFGSQLNK
jgi:hypothetical protein